MASFSYTARDAQGAERRGVEDAPSVEMLAGTLRGRGWMVVRIEPLAEPRATAFEMRLNPMRLLPVTSFDVEIGLRQLAAMLHSGLTLLAGLETVAEQSRRAAAAAMWRGIGAHIERGGTLSEAMLKYGRRFSEYIVQMARVGESAGELPQLLEQAAEHLESNRNLRLMVLNALSYPVLVVLMAIGVSAFMMLGVIPKIERFLRDSGNVLPPLTQALLDMSQWLTQHLPGIGIGLGVVLVAMFTISRWPPGRLWLHKIWLRMPVVGGISRLAETSVFARGMSILLESGVTLIDGLQTVEGLVRNRAVARRVAESRVAVARGETLAHALGAGSEFLPMLPRMVTVGESTGLLGRTLGDVAKFHESQLVATIRKLGLVIEPVMIIVVGGIVGFVYVAFFMALFSMASGAG